MKNKSYFIVLAFITSVSLLIASCNFMGAIKGNGKIVSVDRELNGEFAKVEIEGTYTLNISQGTTPKLRIETDENLIPYIETKVKNHKLIVKNKRRISSAKDIIINLTIGTITDLEASGAVLVRSAGKINFDKFNMELNGASNVLMEMNCVEFNAECNGSSTLKLIGAASDSKIEVSGACDIDNQQMIVENMNLIVNGGAKVIVNVLTKLDVKVNGAAQVEYLGAPEVHKEISGAGSVEKIF